MGRGRIVAHLVNVNPYPILKHLHVLLVLVGSYVAIKGKQAPPDAAANERDPRQVPQKENKGGRAFHSWPRSKQIMLRCAMCHCAIFDTPRK